LNYNADFSTAQTIVNELKSDELASGREYSTEDIAQLIRQKYKGVNENIVQIAVDMIMNDAETFLS
jgi:ribonuclease I